MNLHLVALGLAQSRVALLGPDTLATASARVQHAFDGVAELAARGGSLSTDCAEMVEATAAEDAFVREARSVLD